jgi:hypothetical protein
LLLQLPQLSVFEATHEPLQESSPPEQTQLPAWHMLPVPHTFAHAPQFWLSVCTFVHEPLHSICSELHMGPVIAGLAGLAQLARTSAEPKRAAKAKREALRESIVLTPYGGSGG